MSLIRASQPVVTRVSPHNKNRRYIKAYGGGRSKKPRIPDNALLTLAGDVLTTQDGQILTGANTVPTSIEDYLPYTHGATNAEFTTQVEADNNANPTNWVDIMTVTMPASKVVDGIYDISASWSFNIDSVTRSAYFRFVLNGIPTGFVRIESADKSDINSELLRKVAALGAGADIVVTGQCVLENVGGTDTLTIDAGGFGISIECKVNNQ